MILIHEKRLVIITPPHTASGALHNILCSPIIGGIWVNGPNPGGGICHHYGKVHDGWIHDEYRVLMIVREPGQRARGLYDHYIWWLNRQGLEAEIPFVEYLKDPPNHWMHQETQYCYYMRCGLGEIGAETIPVNDIADLLADGYGIEIRPKFDVLKLRRKTKTPFPVSEKWENELRFWEFSGCM